MTTGGALAEAARADGVPVIGVPSGMQPRAAVAYMTVGALEVAALAGVTDSLRGEVEAAAALLRELSVGVGRRTASPDGEAEGARARAAGPGAGRLRRRAHRARSASAGARS